MSTFSSDPLTNAVQQGIKRGIDVLLDAECFPSAVILIYSAMDTMAFLGMPATQADVRGPDFVAWVDRYIKFPCKEKISGLEFYGARCSTLHTFGVASKLSREGKVRMIGYGNHMVPEVLYRPEVSTELVFVSVKALRDALFAGIDNYLVDLFADSTRCQTAEHRVKQIFNTLPIKPGGV